MTTNTGRIIKEIKEVSTNPEKYFKIYVSEDNIMDWYIMYYNIDDPRFKDGSYILHIKLPEGYPFQAPDFRWLTPNGRFEVNKKICYNISSYHNEQWNALWRMRTIIIGIFSMLLDTNTTGIGHIQNTTNDLYSKFAFESIKINKDLVKKYHLNFDKI